MIVDNAETADEAFALSISRHFGEWLATIGGSVAFTTYQAGKLFLIGLKQDGSLSVFERSFERCMGLAATDDGRSLLLATRYQVQRFDNVLQSGQSTDQGYDAVYAPHAAWVTGDIDVHDIGFGADGRPVFVNTLFGCIAAASDGHSFKPLWKPSFITRLAAEDRCHLNGMALENGIPRYATAVSQSDMADGWRDFRRDGGVVIDTDTGEIVAAGLSMPHSPRLYNGRLWVLNSGRGELGYIDRSDGVFHTVALCPGYARGLTIVGKYGIVGLSQARGDRTFFGLDLDDILKAAGTAPRCGLAVFDLDSGDLVHWLRIEGVVKELYDVVVLKGIRRPSAIGFKTNEVSQIISIDG